MVDAHRADAAAGPPLATATAATGTANARLVVRAWRHRIQSTRGDALRSRLAFDSARRSRTRLFALPLGAAVRLHFHRFVDVERCVLLFTGAYCSVFGSFSILGSVRIEYTMVDREPNGTVKQRQSTHPLASAIEEWVWSSKTMLSLDVHVRRTSHCASAFDKVDKQT